MNPLVDDFLRTYSEAESLDSEKYKAIFKGKGKQADFTIFDRQIVCECKCIEDVDYPKKAEQLAFADPVNFKRDMYDRISVVLSSAGKQIRNTKRILNLPNAFGLIVLENAIKSDVSAIALHDAADRKMKNGLEGVDFVFYIDHANVFENKDGRKFHMSATLCRGGMRDGEFFELFRPLQHEYLESNRIPEIRLPDIRKIEP